MERRPVLAVTFALLMLASTVTMSGAAAAFGDSHDDLEPREPALTYQQPVLSEPAQSIGTPNGTTDEGLPSITDPRLNPHQRVALANITLHDIEGESRQEERALSQARDRIETALDHYEAGRATSRQAFDAQARTLQALARMTGGSHDSTIRNVSEGLFLASNESARIAVRDANGSLRTFSNDLDRNERRFVENALGNAEAAFDRADRMAEPRGRGNGRNALRRQVQSRANAIDHYRAGYHHAGRALDRMERAVDPELSLSQGQAFERNDSVHVVVDTTLTDIRPYAYDEATVTVTNGSANASAIRFRRAIPGSSYTTGSTIVDLGPDAENVTLTVSSNASHDESRKVEETIELSVENVEVIPDPPDPDEYNEVELRNESTGVSVEAAGEGLWEERMRITNETPASDQAFRAAPVVRVESQTAIDHATIRIPIDERVPQSQYENLSVYTWNGSQGSQWHRVNTTIENGTAIAHVEHFSFFTVLDDLLWHDRITETITVDDATSTQSITFERQSDFDCSDPCGLSNATTLHIGGSANQSGESSTGITASGSQISTSGLSPVSNGSLSNVSFAGGNGTAADPYQIATVEQLQLIQTDKDAHYVLIRDIDASETEFWNGGRGFDPIGDNGAGRSEFFSGTIDGNDHTIANLHINRSESGVGLFGWATDARFSNIQFRDWHVSGNRQVGSLAGNIRGGASLHNVRGSNVTVVGRNGRESIGGLVGSVQVYDGSDVSIEHSSVSGTVHGASLVGGLVGYIYADESVVSVNDSHSAGSIYLDSATSAGESGGLVGIAYGTSIFDSSSSVDILVRNSTYVGPVGGLVGDFRGPIIRSYATGDIHEGESSEVGSAGGLVGSHADGETAAPIRSSFATGDVTVSGDYVGGLVGYRYGDNAPIIDSFATGDVTGTDAVGGLVGELYSAGDAIENSYSNGAVTAFGENAGGLVGARDSETRITNSYWDVTTSGLDQSDGGTGLTTSEMTGEAASTNLTGFDFGSTWTTTESYPRLSWAPASLFNRTAASASWTIPATDAVSEYSLQYRPTAIGQDATATVSVSGENGSRVRRSLQLGNGTQRSLDLNVSTLEGNLDFQVQAENTELRLRLLKQGSAIDTDDDGLPDALEERNWTMPVGSFGNVTTSPHDADTDGDGLEDGEEIEFRIEEETEEGTVYRIRATSNPTLVHSDDDGIPDGVEERGWEIRYTDDREDSAELQEALSGTDDDEVPDLEPYLTTENVSSSPLLEDSNGDGLSDPENRELGTDPWSADTTGDGIRDAEALQENWDPTLFDTAPPQVSVNHADIWSDRGEVSVNYFVQVSLQDPAGTGQVTLLVDGELVESKDMEGSTAISPFLEGSGGALDNFAGFYLGQSMTVRVTDTNGNTRTVIADRRESIFGHASLALAEEGFVGRQHAEHAGTLQGVATGAGETAGMVRAFFEDPSGYTRAILESLEALSDIEAVIEQLPASIEAQQREQNPHKPGTALNESFREGWYQGYIGFLILESVYPLSKATDVVKNSQRVQSTFNALDRSGRLTTVARQAARGYDTATTPLRFANSQLARGVSGSIALGSEAAGRVISAGRTTAQKYRIYEQLRRFDPRTIERLSPGEQTRLGQFLSRYGDDGGRLMADGGEDLRRLIVRSDGLDEDTTRSLLRAHARGDLDDADLQLIANRLDSGSIDEAALRETLSQLERINREGHDVLRLRTSEDVNAQLINERGSDYEPPYEENSFVVEFETSTTDEFARVHREGNQVGDFLVRRDQIRGLSPTEIQNTLSLSYEPSYISNVNVPEGASMRAGTVRANFGGDSGARQYQLISRIDPDNFDGARRIEE